jgi:hypothetical protein
MKIYIKKISYITIVVLVVFVVYTISYYVWFYNLSYENPIHIKNAFTLEDISIMQSCTNNNSLIDTPCYKRMHLKIINTIKEKLGINYLYIDHARFSNNSNGDGQSFHKDVKPRTHFRGQKPNVYTIILYLDEAGIYIGNKKIKSNPGDIVIFNSLNMHKAIGINPFSSTKQRRVLQLFGCFFNEHEKDEFYKKCSTCSHYGISTLNKYLDYFIEPRWFVEYTNTTHFMSNKCDKNKNVDFDILIKNKKHNTLIHGVKYYYDI